jgi:hypothetical protein
MELHRLLSCLDSSTQLVDRARLRKWPTLSSSWQQTISSLVR